MARGGYRKPSKPAPVSGPGALSRRTDGGPAQAVKEMGGGRYGERKQLTEMQAGAPMAGRPQTPQPKLTRASVQAASNLPPVTPLTAPTQRPDEPLTAGMPFGAGPGSEALGMGNGRNKPSAVLQKIIMNDPTGEVSELYQYLISRGL